MNKHTQLRVAKPMIERVVALLELAPGETDERLKLDTLEGETDFFELIDGLLEEIENDEGTIAALDAQVDVRSIRIERAKKRIEQRKAAISALMDYARETTVRRPQATLSLRTLGPRPKVADADELPDEFVIEKVVRKPNTELIKEAVECGQSIPGVVMSNGGSSLTVRRK